MYEQVRSLAFDFNAVQTELMRQEGDGGGGLTEKMCRARFAELQKATSPRKEPVPVQWSAGTSIHSRRRYDVNMLIHAKLVSSCSHIISVISLRRCRCR